MDLRKQLVMDLRKQLQSEQSLRYAAECRRMARLARRERRAASPEWPTRSLSWLAQASLASRDMLQGAKPYTLKPYLQNFSRAS
jgi:hypothetical protein